MYQLQNKSTPSNVPRLSKPDWKTSIVVPISKPGGRGHRPIFILTTILKIMERLILARLIFKLHRPKHLFGFTKGRSTVEPILHLVNLITNRRRKFQSDTVYTAFLDLDKAFERDDHIVILDALISLRIKERIISWVEDFLNNREIKVTFQGGKLQTALDKTASKANDIGLFLSPAKTKLFAFNTNSKQHITFHIGRH